MASFYGRQIIDQFHAKSNRKVVSQTRPDLPVGTFLFGDIFFHFAADYDEDDSEMIDMLCRKTNHELKAINAINATSSDIHTTLMTLIDYKGFRLVAYAVMPLDEKVNICRFYGIKNW